jgi:hypothetical protein
MPSLTRKDIKKDSPLHATILSEVRRRVMHAEREWDKRRDEWRRADESMVAYVPESEADARRDNKRYNAGVPAYTTIKVPYSYGIAMALHSYLCSVFLSRSPVFQFEGLNGQGQNQVMALEALHHYQYRVGGMGSVLFCYLYDLVKYGTSVSGINWANNIRYITTLKPEMDETGNITSYEQAVSPMQGYQGNELFNMSLFDFLPDPRFSIKHYQRGEYCAARWRLSWQQVKERELLGYYTNLEDIDPRIAANFQTDNDRDRESRAIPRPSEHHYEIDLTFAARDSKRRPEVVPVYECYINLIPKDWNLGNSDYPTKWVFTVTGDWRTVIGATPFSAIHADYPFMVDEIEFDAFALSNRGIPQITKGIQDTMDWQLNSHMYNVRAALNNLFVVDPSRVNLKDITDPLPGGIIRLRGLPIPGADDPVKQLVIQDLTRGHITDMGLMDTLGERATGIGDILMGSMPSGGRRTATESRQSAAAGTSRGKVISEFVAASGFRQLGRQLVMNNQQYLITPQRVRIVGNLAQQAGPGFLEVRPEDIAGEYDFSMVDGSLPVDRFAQLNLWKELLAGVLAQPQLAAQFDLARIFMWMAQLGGLRNVDSFRLQLGSPEQLQQQALSGEVVPINGEAGGNPDYARQMPGVGPVNVGNLLNAA